MSNKNTKLIFKQASNMKKTYIIPTAQVLCYNVEMPILSGSIPINSSGDISDEITSEDDAWSNDVGGWSSENWSR